MPEVAGYEPHLALDGGENGLAVIARIRNVLPQQLCPGGQFFLEIGAEQGAAVLQLFQGGPGGETEFAHLEIVPDYAGRDRVLYGRMNGG
jgi:release factor glutamine methyltransferase